MWSGVVGVFLLRVAVEWQWKFYAGKHQYCGAGPPQSGGGLGPGKTSWLGFVTGEKWPGVISLGAAGWDCDVSVVSVEASG